jgi:electron transfer flavoprotein alpha/beta subunit
MMVAVPDLIPKYLSKLSFPVRRRFRVSTPSRSIRASGWRLSEENLLSRGKQLMVRVFSVNRFRLQIESRQVYCGNLSSAAPASLGELSQRRVFRRIEGDVAPSFNRSTVSGGTFSLRIVVPIKQVPEITEVKVDPQTKTLVRSGVPSILNPFDEFAVEEAVRLKEKHGGEVIVITMGPPQAVDALKKCLAMGADRAFHLCDTIFAGADTWVTAYTLAKAIKTLTPFDLVICGKQAIDGDTAQVGPEIAECLGIPQVTYVVKVEVGANLKSIKVRRETDDGYEVIDCRLPALLTAMKGLNEPRLPSLMAIMAASKKEIKMITAKDLGGDAKQYGLAGSPTQVMEVFTPEARKGGVRIDGTEDPEKAAKQLVEWLLKKGAIR